MKNKYLKLVTRTLTEGSELYPIYHDSYSSAISAVVAYAEKNGYTVDEESLSTEVTFGQRKPSSGDTRKINLKLLKNGVEDKKVLHAQVYNMDNRKYELNMYIS